MDQLAERNSNERRPRSPLPVRLRRLGMVGTIVGIAAFGLLSPRGFATNTPRFWVNEIVPATIFVLAAAALCLRRRSGGVSTSLSVQLIGGLWIGVAIAARIVFPITTKWLFLLPFAIGLFLLLGRSTKECSRLARFAAIFAGALLGSFCAYAQRAAAASTRPLNAEAVAELTGEIESRSIPINSIARFHPQSGDLSLTLGRYSVWIDPMLRFRSRSPDGCWTIFAARDQRKGLPWDIDAARASEGRIAAAYLAFPKVAPRWLESIDETEEREAAERLSASIDLAGESAAARSPTTLPAPLAIKLDARTRLPSPIYSHLNTFSQLAIFGHAKLFVEFSPAPGKRFEIFPADYPAGRPLRFAYLGDNGLFRVAEARSAEKGPFTTLADGPLARGEPLTLTFFDNDSPIVRLTFDDFAAQASTAISATAGWGVPVNSIEFSLEGSKPNAPASVFLSLAATSVGRGYDSVGHSAGTYRNRMTIQPLVPTTAASQLR